MKIGIFASTFAGSTPAEVFRQVAAAGFRSTQYNFSCSGLASLPDSIGAKDSQRVGAAAAEFGIEVAAVTGTYNMIHPDRRVRDIGRRRLGVIAAACTRIGTGVITLCTGTRDPANQWRHHLGNDEPDAWQDLIESMQAALAIAEAHHVMLGIEPELSNVISSAARARRLLDELKSDRIGVILDAANLFSVATLPEQHRIVSASIELLADRIILAHAKDRARDGSFTTAGKGVLDYRHYLRCLRSNGFDGPLLAHGLAADDAADVAKFLQQNLEETS